MSANTFVAKSLWRWCREAFAGLAGLAVSLVGASSIVANIGHEFIVQPESQSNQVSLVASPVRDGTLVAEPGGHGVVQLADPRIVDGLHPGEAAYFGLTLQLRGATGDAQISLVPAAKVSMTDDLSYEVRSVPDATQCLSGWSAGKVLVSRRAITEPAAASFRMKTATPALETCIRVVHGSDARDVETGAVQWRFDATAA